jgi:hypothetical protein
MSEDLTDAKPSRHKYIELQKLSLIAGCPISGMQVAMERLEAF